MFNTVPGRRCLRRHQRELTLRTPPPPTACASRAALANALAGCAADPSQRRWPGPQCARGILRGGGGGGSD
eukprot:14755114-Alexandrium_andersonii.AAC.1